MGNSPKLLGLIGFPLSHSFSQTYFRKKFTQDKTLQNFDYLNFPIEHINQLPELIHKTPELIGFNVTIPYKEQIIDFLNDIDPVAKKIAAVNTVKIYRKNNEDLTLKGYNTDIYGFKKSLTPFLKEQHKKALILGTGGASKAVAYILNELNIEYLFVSRTAEQSDTINYKDIDKQIMKEHCLIVNTTPLGMYPEIDTAPSLPYQFVDQNFLLYDLVYNPAETKFLKYGKEKGAQIVNGYQMLVEQAEKAWKIFINQE